MPIVVETTAAVRQTVADARKTSLTIGLVPTMGALHAGHASLLQAARQETGFVVATVFINPTQFGPNEDLARYPRTWAADLAMCEREGVDLVFAPQPATMYPADFCTYVEVHGLQDVLCGANRPGHFRGVATVVLKLFNIVQPDVAFFGQKDAQQAHIVGRMVRDLDVPVQLRICPIIRESDGLALSSRNRYLDPEQRRQALVLSQALTEARQRIDQGERSAAAIRAGMAEKIAAQPGAQLDYAEVVDVQTLQPRKHLQGEVLLAVAVRFGTTRLIDNIQLHV